MSLDSAIYDVKTIPLKTRLKKAFLIAVPIIGLGLLIGFIAIKDGESLDKLIFPFILCAFGSYLLWAILVTSETKNFTGTLTIIPNEAGKKKAKFAFVSGIVLFVLCCFFAYSIDMPLWAPILAFIPIGLILAIYIKSVKSPFVTFVLSPEAEAEKQRLEAIEGLKSEESRKKEEYVMQQWWFRYPAALLLGVGSLWLYDAKPNLWWISVFLAFLVLLLANEIVFWILGIAALWAVIAGLASLPVSLAIVLGAFIIATAIRR